MGCDEGTINGMLVGELTSMKLWRRLRSGCVGVVFALGVFDSSLAAPKNSAINVRRSDLGGVSSRLVIDGGR